MASKIAPRFDVSVQPEGHGAQRVDQSLRILSLEYEDDDSKTDKLTLTVDNWDRQAMVAGGWRKGNMLHVSWGYPGRMSPVRKCVIHEVKGFKTLAVTAYDRGILMHGVKKSRVFHDSTRSSVVRKIAAEYGYAAPVFLSAAVAGTNAFNAAIETARARGVTDARVIARIAGAVARDIEETHETHATITQARQTDAQFLARLARKEGFRFFIDFDGLHWHRRRFGQRPIREYQWYEAIDERPDDAEVEDIDFENGISGRSGSHRLKGRDPINKTPIDQVGSNATTDRDALSPTVEVVSTAETVNDDGETNFVKRTATESVGPTSQPTDSAAKRHADAKYRDHVQTTFKGTMRAIGDPEQLAKSVIVIRGLGDGMPTHFYVKSVKHTVAADYKMEVKIRSDGHTGKGVASKGKLNKGEAPSSADADALEPAETVNDDGETAIRYRPAGGRAAGENK